MKKTVLIFGSIAGLIVATFMATTMAIMANTSGSVESTGTSMVIGFASMAAAFSFVFVGIKNYRDKHNGGVISFGKAFWLGFLISFVASSIYVLTWAVEFNLFIPDFMDKYTNMNISYMVKSGLKDQKLVEAVYDSLLNNYQYKHNPFFFTMYTYFEILPVGILITLISALILKRKTAAV